MKLNGWMIGLCGLGLVAAGCANHQEAKEEAAACHSPDVLMDQPTAAANAPESKKAPARVAKFGAESKLTDADAVPVEKVLSNPDQYKEQYVRVTGTVTSVCAKKGCWLRLAPKGSNTQAAGGDVFIKFQDPSTGRLVPMEAIGHEVTAEGVVKVGQMSEAAARHYKKDSGASDDEVAKIVGPQKQVVLVKPSVAIEGVASAATTE